MIVVSNISPIMNPAAIEQLNLLEQLYGKVLIPEAVLQELSTVGSKQLGLTAIQTLSWIETRSVANRSLVNMLLLE